MAKRLTRPARTRTAAPPTAPVAPRTPARQKKTRVSEAQAAKSARLKACFLAAYLTLGNIAATCRQIGVGRRTVYDWKANDPTFLTQYDDVEDDAVDGLEGEATRRAVQGVDKPVYQGGKLVGHVREYSDTLLIFLLKGKRPEVYRERFEHSGPKGGPIAIHQLPDAELDLRILALEHQLKGTR